ncbi:MAG: hypothetical protein B6241_07635 [Spirochaetaceae bacterium 4572_59]|nr:MAG: hypothetical protein B6241_07635 [Spirochaetaceae bacterium 4572_59]
MKNSKVLSFLSIILLSVTFIGCSIFSDDNDDDGKDLILSGYYWMAGDEESVADDASGRASINIYDLIGSNDTSADYKFSTLMTNSTNKNRVNDYPEKGMKSYYTVTLEDEDTSIAPDAYKSDLLNVYKIKVTSHYPRRKYLFDYYQEEYYILDVNSTDATGAPLKIQISRMIGGAARSTTISMLMSG